MSDKTDQSINILNKLVKNILQDIRRPFVKRKELDKDRLKNLEVTSSIINKLGSYLLKAKEANSSEESVEDPFKEDENIIEIFRQKVREELDKDLK